MCVGLSFIACYNLATATPLPRPRFEVDWSHRPNPSAQRPREDRTPAQALSRAARGNRKLSHGEPSWFAGGKQFVTTADHHHDDRLGAWLAAPDGAQEMLVKAHPERFFRPPYVGQRGWLGIYLDVEVDWVEVGIMVEHAYRQVAPKRMLAQLER